MFNSFRPYSARFSFPPLHMAHSADQTLKYVPGSLSLPSHWTALYVTWTDRDQDKGSFHPADLPLSGIQGHL